MPLPQTAELSVARGPVTLAGSLWLPPAGSPRLGDKEAWGPRIKTGSGSLMQSVFKGKGSMPPRAGNPSLSDAEIRAAVDFMVGQSK